MLGRYERGANGEAVVIDVATPAARSIGIDEIRSEFGIEGGETSDNSEDFETTYQTAVVYQEMGMIDEAIRLFQEAASSVSSNDGSRRFFQCANLLGHCFHESGHPGQAVVWYERALETDDLTDEERQGLWYELATVLEADGRGEDANRFYMRVYTENVDYRDVAARLRTSAVVH